MQITRLPRPNAINPSPVNPLLLLQAPAQAVGSVSAGFSTAIEQAIELAIQLAYVETFRVLMWVCAALAALSGVVAWWSLPDRLAKSPAA